MSLLFLKEEIKCIKTRKYYFIWPCVADQEKKSKLNPVKLYLYIFKQKQFFPSESIILFAV